MSPSAARTNRGLPLEMQVGLGVCQRVPEGDVRQAGWGGEALCSDSTISVYRHQSPAAGGPHQPLQPVEGTVQLFCHLCNIFEVDVAGVIKQVMRYFEN